MKTAQFYQTIRQYRNRISLKLTVSLLALAFILTPLTPILAQDVMPQTTTTTTTTTYPSKFYNTDGTTATKHIFGNGAEVGTVTGTGEEAIPRYSHTDQLTGSNLVTNSSGTIDETLDYFPFGGIKIDSGSYSDQRKFAGSEFDSDTGLNYMNARYYDSAAGRFLNEDPEFWGMNSQYLLDPQQWNSYSYARNNPLGYIDRTGEVIQAVNRPVKMFGLTVGVHSFIEIRDNSNINNGQRTTLGGYTTNFIWGDLFKGENYHTDYDLIESDYLSTHEIQAPEQYTQEGFEKKVYESYNNLDTDLGAYSPFGGDLPNGQGNSGNVFTQILLNSGLTKDQILSYKTKRVYDAGVGRGVPKNKVQSLPTRINNFKSFIKSVQKSIKDKISKK